MKENITRKKNKNNDKNNTPTIINKAREILRQHTDKLYAINFKQHNIIKFAEQYIWQAYKKTKTTK